MKALAILLILIGMIFTGVGGYMDITGKDEINIKSLKITKKHLLNDGIYVTILAIALLVFSQNNY